MISIDSSAGTEIEMKRESITKHRYLEFRDQRSTSRKLSYRIEGIRLSTSEQLEKEFLNRCELLTDCKLSHKLYSIINFILYNFFL